MIEVKVKVTVIRTLEGWFNAETVNEAVATAEMEGRNNGEIDSITTMVMQVNRAGKPSGDNSMYAHPKDK